MTLRAEQGNTLESLSNKVTGALFFGDSEINKKKK